MTPIAHQPTQVGILAADSMVRLAADAIDDNDVGAVVVGLDSVDGIVSARDLLGAFVAR